MSDRTEAEVKAKLALLARSLPQESFAGAEPVGPLDVEGALANVLARAKDEQRAEAERLLEADARPAARKLRWTTWVGAAAIAISFLAPWLVRTRVEDRPRQTAQVPSAWLAGVTSTSAVVFWTP